MRVTQGLRRNTALEVTQLDAAIPVSPLRTMVVLALNTGLRLGEILALKKEAVDLKRRRLVVRLNLNDDGSLGTPKSGKSREVPLNTLAWQALADCLQLVAPTFCSCVQMDAHSHA